MFDNRRRTVYGVWAVFEACYISQPELVSVDAASRDDRFNLCVTENTC